MPRPSERIKDLATQLGALHGDGVGCTLAVGRGAETEIPAWRRKNHMRMLLRGSVLVEASNAAANAGTLGSTVERMLADLKTEEPLFAFRLRL